MANPKILEAKQVIIDEIANNVKESSSFIFLENNGLSVSETMELRRKLRESNSELKIYKNTLVARALKDLNIDLDAEYEENTLSCFINKQGQFKLFICELEGYDYVGRIIAAYKSYEV